MKFDFDPQKVAEAEASRWLAMDRGNLEDVFAAHKTFVQEHYGLPEAVAHALTTTRARAGKARADYKRSVSDQDRVVAQFAVVASLAEYYTQLREALK